MTGAPLAPEADGGESVGVSRENLPGTASELASSAP